VLAKFHPEQQARPMDRPQAHDFVPRGRRAMSIRFHKGDLPDDADFGNCVAIATETLGLVPHRDRLCVIQLSRADQRLGRASLTCGNLAEIA
jgi:hypothetical protein